MHKFKCKISANKIVNFRTKAMSLQRILRKFKGKFRNFRMFKIFWRTSFVTWTRKWMKLLDLWKIGINKTLSLGKMTKIGKTNIQLLKNFKEWTKQRTLNKTKTKLKLFCQNWTICRSSLSKFKTKECWSSSQFSATQNNCKKQSILIKCQNSRTSWLSLITKCRKLWRPSKCNESNFDWWFPCILFED